MSTRDSELEAVTLDMLVIEPPSEAAFTFSPLAPIERPQHEEEERILEPDEISAELVETFEVRFLPPTPAQRRARAAESGAAQAPAASALAATPLSRAHSEITVNGAAAHKAQPSGTSELEAAREELARLQTQMRARDAYLKELEGALDASTRQLEASGIGSVHDAYRMLGTVRGQAFRIAELESELRHARQALALTASSPRSRARNTRVKRAR